MAAAHNFVGGNEESQEIIDRVTKDAGGRFNWRIRYATHEIAKAKRGDGLIDGPTWRSYDKSWNIHFNPLEGTLSLLFFRHRQGELVHRSRFYVMHREKLFYSAEILTFEKCVGFSVKLFEGPEELKDAILQDGSLYFEVAIDADTDADVKMTT